MLEAVHDVRERAVRAQVPGADLSQAGDLPAGLDVGGADRGVPEVAGQSRPDGERVAFPDVGPKNFGT